MSKSKQTMDWRQSTRDEIQRYYREEFPTFEENQPPFISAAGPKEYALAFRSEYPIRGDGTPRDFIRRATWETKNGDRGNGERVQQRWESFADVIAFIQSPAYNDPVQNSSVALADPDVVVERNSPVPDAVYFKVDNWEYGWPLVFDIDAKDIAANEALESLPNDASLSTQEAVQVSDIDEQPPSGYPYSFKHIRKAIEYGFVVEEKLQEKFGYQDTMVVYSGQGCHIYGLDTDSDHQPDPKAREVMKYYMSEVCDIPIDPAVTSDDNRVMRLPYSLHTGVSRIVTPIQSPDYDFRTNPTPKFLTNENSA